MMLNEVKILWSCHKSFKISLKMVGVFEFWTPFFVDFCISLEAFKTLPKRFYSVAKLTNFFIEFPSKWWFWIESKYFDKVPNPSKLGWWWWKYPDFKHCLFIDFCISLEAFYTYIRPQSSFSELTNLQIFS